MNLFVGSNTNIKISNTDVGVKMETNYPWDGKVKINIDPQGEKNFSVHIRIPEWPEGRDQSVPGDLYKNANASNQFYYLV